MDIIHASRQRREKKRKYNERKQDILSNLNAEFSYLIGRKKKT